MFSSFNKVSQVTIVQRAVLLFAFVMSTACSLLNLDAGLEADRCNPDLPDPCAELNMLIPSTDLCLNWRCNADRYCELLTKDDDGDGFVDPICAPEAPKKDCDDTRADRFPGNAEQCDLVDNDCDDTIDEQTIQTESPILLAEFEGVLRYPGIEVTNEDRNLVITQTRDQTLWGTWVSGWQEDADDPIVSAQRLSAWDCGSAVNPIGENQFVATWIKRTEDENRDLSAAISQVIVKKGEISEFLENIEPEQGVFQTSEQCTQPHFPSLSTLDLSTLEEPPTSMSLLTAYLCETDDSPFQIPRLCQPEFEPQAACELEMDSRKVALSLSEVSNVQSANTQISIDRMPPIVLGTTQDISPPAILAVPGHGWLVAFSSHQGEGIEIHAVPKRFTDGVNRANQIHKLWTQSVSTAGHVNLTFGSHPNGMDVENEKILALTYREGCIVNHSAVFKTFLLTWDDDQILLSPRESYTYTLGNISPGNAQSRIFSPTAVWMSGENRWLFAWLTKNQKLEWVQLTEQAQRIGGETQSVFSAGVDQPLGLTILPLRVKYEPISGTVDFVAPSFKQQQTQVMGVRLSCQ